VIVIFASIIPGERHLVKNYPGNKSRLIIHNSVARSRVAPHIAAAADDGHPPFIYLFSGNTPPPNTTIRQRYLLDTLPKTRIVLKQISIGRGIWVFSSFPCNSNYIYIYIYIDGTTPARAFRLFRAGKLNNYNRTYIRPPTDGYSCIKVYLYIH